jgi:hypothetical protein
MKVNQETLSPDDDKGSEGCTVVDMSATRIPTVEEVKGILAAASRLNLVQHRNELIAPWSPGGDPDFTKAAEAIVAQLVDGPIIADAERTLDRLDVEEDDQERAILIDHMIELADRNPTAAALWRQYR